MAAPGLPSGTYTWGAGTPPISELVLDAYERCGKLGVELTSQYIQSARRSLNLVLSSWANRGINLWTVQQVPQYMPQGVGMYVDDASCVDILPDSMIIRQYAMGSAASVTPAFSTTSGSHAVTVSNLPGTPIVNGYISIGVPVSVGGIILQGFYQVQSTPAANQAVILAASNATATVTNGGVVPQFTISGGTLTVNVFFPNHGLSVGQTFVVQVATTLEGYTLLGPYPVSAVGGANNFVISVLGTQQYLTSEYLTDGYGNIMVDDYGEAIWVDVSGATATEYENNGLALLAVQSTSATPDDILIYPLSRGDWMAIPDKFTEGRPTSVWINRQIIPQINVWPIPDANGPYELRYYRSRQIQDADIASGQVLGVPYRLLESFTADLTAHLAMKWAPIRARDLAAYAAEQWTLAAEEDRERTSTFLVPDMSGYFN